MNKQQLANKIWESANKMRSKIEANEYKDYILGFIFYKYLSDQEVKFLKENYFTDDAIKEVTEQEYDNVTVQYNDTYQSFCQQNIGYFIAYENLYSTWLEKGNDFDVSNVTDALSAFSRLISPSHKKVFENIFRTLETGLSKLGDSSNARTKAISNLLQLIKDIPMDGKQDYDVLGFIYEYLIEKFAANAGKKAGEFYTPHEVSYLMSEIVANHLKDRDKIEIYDPTSGSGSLLINIGRSVSKYMYDRDKIKYYAQELKENTFNLTRMNLVMRGIKPDNIYARCGDTLEDDWPYFEENDPVTTYNPLYVDAVVSNPPYSQAWDPTNKENDPRYARFGLAPKGKADYAFLLHDLYHVKPDGIMTIVLPHGVLFRGGEEGQIRKNLIENNHIDAIIGLPANIFFGTGIPTIIVVLKQHRKNTDVLIIDASKGFAKEGKNNKLRASDIKRIVDTVTKRGSVDRYARVVSREEIRNNEYNLNIPRYVDSSEPTETWDLYASMFGGIPETELQGLHAYWDAFPELKDSLFSKTNEAYSKLQVTDVKKALLEHPSLHAFKERYAETFNHFETFLAEELIEKMQNVNPAQEEESLSKEIFSRLDGVPLIDPYEAYQQLDEEWKRISIDLEIIQTEGFAAIKKVDPNLVIKKKDGKDQEVQEGWKGHILPFELVQQALLADELETLNKLEERQSGLTSDFEEQLEALSEEDKERPDWVLNETKDAFVPAEVKKALKMKDEEPEVMDILKQVDQLIKEEKDLKKKIKAVTEQLHLHTKTAIESLSDEEARDLLKRKWITPLVKRLDALPETVMDHFAATLQALCKKYETTFSEVEEEISQTEHSLCEMIDDLTGSEFDMQGLAALKKLLGDK